MQSSDHKDSTIENTISLSTPDTSTIQERTNFHSVNIKACGISCTSLVKTFSQSAQLPLLLRRAAPALFRPLLHCLVKLGSKLYFSVFEVPESTQFKCATSEAKKGPINVRLPPSTPPAPASPAPTPPAPSPAASTHR